MGPRVTSRVGPAGGGGTTGSVFGARPSTWYVQRGADARGCEPGSVISVAAVTSQSTKRPWRLTVTGAESSGSSATSNLRQGPGEAVEAGRPAHPLVAPEQPPHMCARRRRAVDAFRACQVTTATFGGRAPDRPGRRVVYCDAYCAGDVPGGRGAK